MNEPQERRIDDIIVRNHIRQDLGDIQGLAESIRKYGLLHAIVITPDNVLVAGLRRLKACELLEWETIPVKEIGDCTR